MAKFEVRTSPKAKRASTRPDTVAIKTIAGREGGKLRVLAVDANSPSFGDDFLYVFTQNVRRARKENKERLGSTSGAKRGG